MLRLLVKRGALKERFVHGSPGPYLMALDGTWFHSSEELSCPNCLGDDHHHDGRGASQHSAVAVVLVRPGTDLHCNHPFCGQVLKTEFR